MAEFNYSLWEEEDDIPARSRLYSLEMDGSDGRTQEALLDYCQRLATAHRVHVADLLKSEIIPLTQIRGALYSSRFSLRYAKTFNGYGKYAAQIADALHALTGQTSLNRGTFLHWKPILDPKGSGLLHPVRRWCPSCLAERLDTGSTITHALIWSVSIVTHCPIHLTPLRQTCEACGATQPFLSDQIPLGRCAHCGTPLGARDGLWSYDPPSERQQFFGNAVAEMIAMGARAQELAQPDVFGGRMKDVILVHFGNSIGQFEREIGFRKTSTAKWFRMESRPQFDLLLELCYRISVPPVALLSGTFAESGKECHIHKHDTPAVNARKKPSEALASEIREKTDLIVNIHSEYVDATAFARTHGISIGYFKYWFPEQYKALTAHRKSVQSLLTQARIDRTSAKTRAVIRELYATSHSIPRRRITTALKSVGISTKDPKVRAAAFDERDRLESQLARISTPPVKES